MDWCRMIYQRVLSGAARQNVSLPRFDDFWDAGFIEMPPPDEDFVLFADFRRDPIVHPLKTPSGRIEITSETIAGFGYDDCPPHPAWRAPQEWLGGAEAARWPLHLITHQPADRLHSQMDPGPVSRSDKIRGRERVRLNPEDAAQRGVRATNRRVFNDRGSCLAAAVVEDGIMPGVVVMATGAWFDPGEAAEPERHGNPECADPRHRHFALGPGPERVERARGYRTLGQRAARYSGLHGTDNHFCRSRLGMI